MNGCIPVALQVILMEQEVMDILSFQGGHQHCSYLEASPVCKREMLLCQVQDNRVQLNRIHLEAHVVGQEEGQTATAHSYHQSVGLLLAPLLWYADAVTCICS